MTLNSERILRVADPVPSAPTVERQADRLFNDMFSPEEVQRVRLQVRDAAERTIAPIAARIAGADERLHGFPRDAFEAMAAENLFRIPFDSSVGGDGLSRRATCTAAAVEELAYFSNSVAAIYDVHCILAGNALAHGNDAQRDRWLRPIVSGDLVGSFATSEPGASSDLSPQAVQTVASPNGDGWVINGRKRWITNSVVAGVILVLARTDTNLTMFIVPADTAGVSIGTPDQKLGNRGQITADVILDDICLGPESVLGPVGAGLKIALQTLTFGRIGIGAAGVGMAQAAFDRTVAHLKSRHAFGGPLASKQHWQFLMADYAAELECARSLYLKAALRLDGGQRFPEPEAAMAKVRGTELASRIASDAVQAFGGLGFVRSLGADDTEGPVEAIYRDAKIGEIYEGANEIQRWVLARQIFGRAYTA